MSHFIGQSLRRREDHPLLVGQGQYAGDVSLPGMLHMAVVRSPHPHARLLRVDLAPARAMPGVAGAYAVDDLPEIGGPMRDSSPPDLKSAPRPVLARDVVRYVGEPIAVVVAADPGTAVDAAASVQIDFEPLAGAGTVLAATRPDAPLLHPRLGSNLAGQVVREFGDVAGAFSGEQVTVVRRGLRLGRVIGGYLEPRATAADLDPATDELLVWTSTQTVYGVRDRIASILGLPPPRVRVMAPDVGGGFGAKGQIYPEEILVPALARRLKRPVRWVATRTEDTQATGQSHGDAVDGELAANADGTLRGLRVHVLHDVGAYGGPGLGQSDNILSHLISAYRLPALEARSSPVYTNTVPTGFIRGGGREVGNFLIERLMDALAQRLELDPAEVRRRNLIQPAAMPYTTGYVRMGSPVVYDGGDYPRLLDSALQAVDYAEARARQAAGAHIGVGVACCVESTGARQPEPARVRVDADGWVTVYLGSTPGGQGHQTTFSQVAAHHLGWPVGRVAIVAGDTAAVSNSANTAGSRSALEVGNAVAQAARAARAQLVEVAGARLEVAPTDVVLGPDGAEVRGVPGRGVALADLLNGQASLLAEETFHSAGAYTSAVHAVVLRVEPDLATIEVERYAIAHDCGQPINPLLVDGQLQGGLVHGAGYALMEHAVYFDDGTFATANFADYTLPGRGIPMRLQPRLVDVRSPVLGKNPEGFKGVGETGTIAAPAAFAAALEDALHRLGIRAEVDTLPVTPNRLYGLLNSCRPGTSPTQPA